VVIAVTGSGKRTTVIKLIEAMLENHFKTEATAGSVSDPAAAFLSLLQLPEGTDVYIFETDPQDEETAAELFQVLQPGFNVITGVEGAGDKNQTKGIISLAENLMKASASLILDGDDPLLDREWKADAVKAGFSDGCLFKIHSVEETGPDNSEFSIEGIRLRFQINSSELQHIKYAAYAVAVCVHLGLPAEAAAEKLESFSFSK
jgi:UDP-N-acetylmuramoyl-tripeptide--D-alanyl-D-alanine ligase